MHSIALIIVAIVCQWYIPTRAQTCGNSAREFAVGNCTACPTRDHTRGGIPMAECKPQRVANISSYKCVCHDYPADANNPMVWYYPQRVAGNATPSCSNVWSQNPALYSVLGIVPAGISVYALIHLLYIVVASGMFSCGHEHFKRKRRRCTPINAAALTFALYELGHVIRQMCRVVPQGEITIGSSGAGPNSWIGYSLDGISYYAIITFNTGSLLYFTSMVGTVYLGQG